MAYILKGMRYHSPIEERCEDIDECLYTARSWLPSQASSLDDPEYTGIGWAAPTCIEDELGNVIIDEKELDTLIYD